MKIYMLKNQLHIVGKAWEVRHQLRKLSKQYGHTSLAKLYYATSQASLQQ